MHHSAWTHRKIICAWIFWYFFFQEKRTCNNLVDEEQNESVTLLLNRSKR